MVNSRHPTWILIKHKSAEDQTILGVSCKEAPCKRALCVLAAEKMRGRVQEFASQAKFLTVWVEVGSERLGPMGATT
jgi:hypothetical protein